jgi:hypothetical protein
MHSTQHRTDQAALTFCEKSYYAAKKVAQFDLTSRDGMLKHGSLRSTFGSLLVRPVSVDVQVFFPWCV